MSSHSPPLGPRPTLSLSTLPPEILVHVIEEVANLDEDDDEHHRVGKTYSYERPGSPMFANLAALSEVSMLFWELSKPTLWKSLDLDNRSNADLLYLITVILPRYGPFIRSFLGLFVGDEGRSRSIVPKYIGEALRILPRLQNAPLPTTDSVDFEVLGEPLTLPLIKYPMQEFVARSESHRDQRIKLLIIIFHSTSTPNLIELGMITDLAERFNDKYIDCIRQSVNASQLKTIELDFIDDSPVPLEPDCESRVSSALSQLITRQQASLEEVRIGFGLDDVQTDTADSLLRMVEVFKVIADLPKLNHFRAKNLAVLPPPLISNSWVCPLRIITISDLWVNWDDCWAFLGQFSATLEEIDLGILGRPLAQEEGETGTTSALQHKVTFPRLREVIIGGNTSISAGIISSFHGSPIQTLLTFMDSGISYVEWINLFDMFKATLKKAGGSKFALSEEEVERLEVEATSRGVLFDTDWHAHVDDEDED